MEAAAVAGAEVGGRRVEVADQVHRRVALADQRLLHPRNRGRQLRKTEEAKKDKETTRGSEETSER